MYFNPGNRMLIYDTRGDEPIAIVGIYRVAEERLKYLCRLRARGAYSVLDTFSSPKLSMRK